MSKRILDACCGGRMFWFDKQDDRAIFQDVRPEQERIVDIGTPGTIGRKPVKVLPAVQVDFRDMPYPDNTFWHVVFDPPHLTKIGANGKLAFNYGKLEAGWRDDIREGFSECFRVLKPNGTLIFKWSSVEIPLKQVLELAPVKPLYGHRTGKKATTHWVAFVKPETQS